MLEDISKVTGIEVSVLNTMTKEEIKKELKFVEREMFEYDLPMILYKSEKRQEEIWAKHVLLCHLLDTL